MSSEGDKPDREQRRVPMADAGPLTKSQREVYDKIVAGKRGKVVGPLRVVLHSPELANRWQLLGEFLRFDTALPEHISELAIICTGRFWNCQLEWLIHSRIGEQAGIRKDIVESIRTGQPPAFDDPLQAAVYEFARELLEYGQVSDGVYHRLLDMIDAATLVELTAVIGYYSMVAMTLNAHQVPVPEDENGALLDLPAGSHLLHPSKLPASQDRAGSGAEGKR